MVHKIVHRWKRNMSSDLDKILQSGIYRQCNHLYKFWWWLVKRSNFAPPHWLALSSYYRARLSFPYTSQHTQQQQPFYGPLSGTTRVSRYQKTHSPTHHPDHHPVFINFFHLPRSIAKLHAWQSFCTTSLHVLFGLPLGLEPSTSYSIHFFTQSLFFFTAHAHTIATCFAVVSILYHLFLVFLSTPYFELCLSP